MIIPGVKWQQNIDSFSRVAYVERPFLNKLLIIPSNTWNNSVDLSFELSHTDNSYNKKINIVVYLNEQEIFSTINSSLDYYVGDIFNYNLDISILRNGINILKIILIDENYVESDPVVYDIYKENKDTIEFIRRFDFKDEWHLSDSNKINISLENKLQLNEYGKAYVRSTDLSNIRTDGKAYINQIIVNGTEDKTFDSARLKMNYAGQLGDGHLFRKKIDVDFYKYLRFL